MVCSKITIFKEIEDAEAIWRAFEKAGDGYVYQSYDWLLSWYRLVGMRHSVKPCLVAIDDNDGRPLMFLPLAIERQQLWSVLTWLGAAFSDYHAPLLSPDAAERIELIGLETIWLELQRQLPPFDYADFQRQPDRVGLQLNPFRQFQAVASDHSAHSTSLSGDWPSYYAEKRSRKTRHNDRRKRKKLESLGRLDFLIAKSADEIDRLVTAMLRQKRDYARAIRKNNVLEEPGYADFLRERATAGLKDGKLVLCGIEQNGNILAVQWGAVDRGRLYSVVASYDSGSSRKLSPGEVLLHEVFKWCFEHNIETFDFTYGDEPYKGLWCESRMPLSHSLIPATTWGRSRVYALTSKIRLKRQIKKRGWLRRGYPGRQAA